MNNSEFAAWCLSMLGQPYWYGTCVFKCTQSLLNSKTVQYPSHYTSSRMSRYKADIAAGKTCSDCIGASKGYAWNNGKKKSEVPDRSANGMFAYAKEKGMEWGTIDTLPEIVGVAVRYDGHVGYYVGDGYVVEWRGFNYGCVKTHINNRPWLHWYKLPWIDYGAAHPIAPEQVTLGSRLLKRGTVGDDVKTLQTLLISLGYDLGSSGADGNFGAKTEAAVKLFQARNGLKQDGIFGEKTHAALMAALPKEDDEEDTPTSGRVEITGGSVYVRAGAGTQFGILTVVHAGQVFDLVSTADNGWFGVVINGRVGWVSGKYGETC